MASLPKIQLARLLIVCISALNSFIHGEDAGTIAFNFPPQTNMTATGDASISDFEIRLTRNQLNSGLTSSLGWAIYNESIPLWDNFSGAVAIFSTHFQFLITKEDDERASGDGLTFFLAPTGLNIANSSPREYLGLFKNTTDGNSSNQIVAVEFDTFKNNDFDPSDNHVGIDVNSIKSKKTISLDGLFGNGTLSNGLKWDAWVDYDGTVNRLQVFLLFNPNSTAASKPGKPILWYDIDLRQYLPQNVKVGFTASIGSGYAAELHRLFIWNFLCQYSSKISTLTPMGLIPAPGPAPDVNVTGQGQIPKTNSIAKIILISALPFFVAICAFLFFGIRWYIRTRKSSGEESDEDLNILLREVAQSAQEFPYAELCAATNSFSNNKKIGVGGFGSVYRGTLPSTNEAVAVERVSPFSKQGKRGEYITEISINSKLTHHNLVKFLGWSHRNGDLLLVYELLPHGSLDKYIFENPEAPLDWDRRYSIACDVASALVYLHEDLHESILHRDIKASNVILDSNFKAKLGDFGLARIVERGKGGHTTTAAGTIGYIAPECVTTGKATRLFVTDHALSGQNVTFRVYLCRSTLPFLF
ncbi:L-type lectin-domain containing receptor kinase V.9-like [Cryptomeria japonica]|uniref:L-type lectin-domain containing receptor kinase V.9-like n=1 Tax=Cryptomeria japonica TaxID=3369 RepID=UPI0027DA020C|nr:L-type lectin-domain containing receptor kinase V.9-like [Cryptomeria japonica]